VQTCIPESLREGEQRDRWQLEMILEQKSNFIKGEMRCLHRGENEVVERKMLGKQLLYITDHQ
jgi:hypothetical protein